MIFLRLVWNFQRFEEFLPQICLPKDTMAFYKDCDKLKTHWAFVHTFIEIALAK